MGGIQRIRELPEQGGLCLRELDAGLGEPFGGVEADPALDDGPADGPDEPVHDGLPSGLVGALLRTRPEDRFTRGRLRPGELLTSLSGHATTDRAQDASGGRAEPEHRRADRRRADHRRSPSHRSSSPHQVAPAGRRPGVETLQHLPTLAQTPLAPGLRWCGRWRAERGGVGDAWCLPWGGRILCATDTGLLDARDALRAYGRCPSGRLQLREDFVDVGLRRLLAGGRAAVVPAQGQRDVTLVLVEKGLQLADAAADVLDWIGGVDFPLGGGRWHELHDADRPFR